MNTSPEAVADKKNEYWKDYLSFSSSSSSHYLLHP